MRVLLKANERSSANTRMPGKCGCECAISPWLTGWIGPTGSRTSRNRTRFLRRVAANEVLAPSLPDICYRRRSRLRSEVLTPECTRLKMLCQNMLYQFIAQDYRERRDSFQLGRKGFYPGLASRQKHEL
jgi:hypothetical protein